MTCLNNSGATPSVALFHARRLNDIRLVSAIAGPRCYIVRVVHDDFVALRLPVSAIKFNLYRHRFSDTGAVVVKKYKKRDSAVRLSPVRHTKRHKRNVVLFF